MSEEKVYQFNEYVLGYDSGLEDRSCLTISKLQNDNLYVMASLYDGSADVISMLLDSLQNKLQQKENIIKEVREYIEEHIRIDDEYPAYMEMLVEEYDKLLEKLDKDNNEKI